MKIILKILKRADHLVGSRLNALESVYLTVRENYSLVKIINIDYRELIYIHPDTLKIISSTLNKRSRNT